MTDPSPEPTRATAAQFRALHSYVIDAVLAQTDDIASELLAGLGGLSIRALRNALNVTGFARIRSTIEDDCLVYLVEIQNEAGEWAVLSRPPATALGMVDNAATRELEIDFHADRLLREITDGDAA